MATTSSINYSRSRSPGHAPAQRPRSLTTPEPQFDEPMKKRKGGYLDRTAEPPCNRKIKFGLTLLALFTLAHAFGQDMIIVINKTGCTMPQGTTFYSGANSFDVRY